MKSEAELTLHCYINNAFKIVLWKRLVEQKLPT